MEWLLPPHIRQQNQHWFWGAILEQKKSYQLALLAGFLSNIFSFAVSLFSMVVYDRILPNAATDSLIALSTGVIIILALDYVIRLIRSSYIDMANKVIDEKVAGQIFSKIVLAKPSANGQRDGETASMVRDFDTLKEFLSAATLVTFVDIPFSLLFLVVIYFIAGPIVVVPIIGILMFCALGYVSHMKMRGFSKKSLQDGQHKQAVLIEALGGRETIRSLNLHDFFAKKWRSAVESQGENQLQSRLIGSESNNRVNAISQLLQVILLMVAVVLSLNGQVAMGGIVAASILSSKALAPYSQVVSLLTRLSQAIQSYRNLDQYLQNQELEELKSLRDQRYNIDKKNATIEFKNVSYAYPGTQHLVLDQVSFSIAPGQRVAVLGRSGSGKTTLIRLMLGLIQPAQGEINFGGINIQHLSSDDFQSTFGVALQDTFLFSGSLIENLSLTDEAINSQTLTSAAQCTGLEAMVSQLPDGYSTKVAERGAQFSGGQKQLIAMTRAIFGEHKTHFIFDEPTSNLDPATEQALIQNLGHYLNGRTVFYVTHRPAPLQMATHVMILEKSKIVAFGPRDQVLEALRKSSQGSPEVATP